MVQQHMSCPYPNTHPSEKEQSAPAVAALEGDGVTVPGGAQERWRCSTEGHGEQAWWEWVDGWNWWSQWSFPTLMFLQFYIIEVEVTLILQVLPKFCSWTCHSQCGTGWSGICPSTGQAAGLVWVGDESRWGTKLGLERPSGKERDFQLSSAPQPYSGCMSICSNQTESQVGWEVSITQSSNAPEIHYPHLVRSQYSPYCLPPMEPAPLRPSKQSDPHNESQLHSENPLLPYPGPLFNPLSLTLFCWTAAYEGIPQRVKNS